MILCDREIRAALEREAICITPDPREDASLWSSTALDLRLGEPISTWMLPAKTGPQRFVPGGADFNLPALIAQHLRAVERTEEGYVVEPGRLHLGWTFERIQLPYRSRIAARVEGKSSLARLGVGVHVTAPTIHAGFGATSEDPHFVGNSIQLEIWNAGPLPVILRPGLCVCQLIFEYVDGTPEKGYSGQFSIQGPEVSTPAPPSKPAARKRRKQ